MNIKKIVSDTVIIILITCVLLAAIEVILRVTFPELKNYRKTPSHALAYEFNKDYLVALKPNVVKEFRIRKGEKEFGKVITWKTNSLGFRGPEIDWIKRPRIIVYGDSNVQARFSEQQDTYPAVLQKLLRQQSLENAEVINAGLIGSGPDENLLRLKHDFDTVKPDIVILHIFADNDYGDIIRNRLFQLSKEGTLLQTNFPTTIDKKLTKLGPAIGYFFRHLYLQGAVNYSILKNQELRDSQLSHQEKVAKTVEILDNAASSAYNIYKKDKPRQFSHFGDFYDIDIAVNPESESARTKITLMKKIVLAAKQFCDDKNIKFIVIVQPSVLDVTQDIGYGGWGYQDLAKRYKNYKPTNLTDPLKEVCATDHLNCVHLIDSYRQNNPNSLYRHDGHWNAKGQQLAAEETAKEIQHLLLIP